MKGWRLRRNFLDLSPLLNPLDVIAASVEQPQGPVDRRPKEISHLGLDVLRWPKKFLGREGGAEASINHFYRTPI